MHDSPQRKPFELAEPPAAAMIESLRGIGYTLETALADLIDNSIAAGARSVWLHLYWDGVDSYISLLDDGHGMNAGELRQAMRPGSRNPLDVRSRTDLGRFGLGLKTASFSQCRSLTVASRRLSSSVEVRRWDLDHVRETDQWQLLMSPRPGSERLVKMLDAMPQGTLVLWEALDRVVDTAHATHRHFLETIERVKEHLAMVFHTYLEDGLRGLRIYLNGTNEEHRIRPWDPFMRQEQATQQLPEEPIATEHGMVLFQGFVLPHPDRLKRLDLLEKGAGPDGWTSQQGFYIYRNRRLLAWGTWLGLGGAHRWKRDELHKLARIRLDIENHQDSYWRIDIKKSTASPPSEIRARLVSLAEDVRERALKVMRSRGEIKGPREKSGSIVRVWNPIERADKTLYRVDRKHPLIAEVLQRASHQEISLEPLLQLIEQSVPVQTIWVDQAKRGERAFLAPSSPPEELLELGRQYLRHFMKTFHDDLNNARRRLMQLDPFSTWSEAILQLNP